jgi:hypothetical protein
MISANPSGFAVFPCIVSQGDYGKTNLEQW